MEVVRRELQGAARTGMFVVVLAMLIAAGDPRGAAATVPAGFDDRHVSTLARPTALAFVPDGRMLITAKDGTLHVMRPGSAPQVALNLFQVTCYDSDRGVMGTAVDPNFDENHFVYLYYTFKKFGGCDHNTLTSPVNRISRFVLQDTDVVDPATETVLVDNIPSPEGIHNGGDLAFGPDGYLYAGVGDGGCDFRGDSGCHLLNDAARDMGGLSGKVLRVTRDGASPPDNPFVGDQSLPCRLTGRTDTPKRCSEVYALGLRNPFRLAFDPDSGRLHINDVGASDWEEVNEGASGADYGWNVREGPCARGSQSNCGPPPSGMTNPVHSYFHGADCVAITAGAFVPSGVWPAGHSGSYIYGDLVCGKLFELEADGVAVQEFGTDLGFVIDATFGPHGTDQALYYITWGEYPNDSIRRISHVGTANRAPEAVAGATPHAGALPLNVQLDGGSSRDADGDPLTYQWTFGDGSDSASAAQVDHTYTEADTYTATLEVSDGRGGEDTTTVEIVAGNEPPEPTIETPTAGTRFAVGDALTLSGSASDSEDGPLPPSALTWEVIRHHNSHTHPYFPRTTGNSLELQGPSPEDIYATTTSHLEVILTATDSGGLSTIVSRDLFPRTVDLTFRTDPDRLAVSVAGSLVIAPTTVTSWEGWRVPVTAPEQRDAAGSGVTFVSWSDGGTRSHEITTPPAPASYTARFTRAYARPSSANRGTFPLVIAYSRCDSPNKAHGPPLGYGSCAPPRQSSSRLTTGTQGGGGAQMAGHIRLAVKPGDPATVADDTDVALDVSLSDVRQAPSLADYPGELELVLDIRITDKLNGPGGEAGTMNHTLRAAVPCTPTPTGSEGSTCGISTTLDTLLPGIVAERARAIWALDQVTLNDGGADSDAETPGNTAFVVQGLFVP